MKISHTANVGTQVLPVRLTLVYLLLNPIGEWWVQVPLLALVATALLFPPLQLKQWLWWCLTLLAAARLLSGWVWMDNHGYLVTYWLLALALALALGEEETLRANAGLLLGLSFAFAVAWKALLAPDFLSGDFFRGIFLTDHRFRDASILLGVVSTGEWAANNQAFSGLISGAVESVALTSRARLEPIALAATWTTLALEAAVAVSFLLPSHWRAARLRHPALLLFAWATYPVAPVAGFGWLLMILGVAHTRPEDRITRWLYLATFLAILVVSETPWTSLLVRAIG